ncbi:MAG: hypothetical protein A2147_07105 [Chloroflexi bacterium RBG_16_57_8]|nr:MAG: hypothetical protein A2147_07105 [Chloroflexi bacterium RBG_16_57_8]
MKSRTSTVNRPKVVGRYYEAVVPDTLDLAERARLGINHFTSMISEEHGYEMYWGSQPICFPHDVMSFAGYQSDCFGHTFMQCDPPMMNFWWSVLHACQPKGMEVMAMERLMSGSQQGLDKEAGMLDMMAGMLGEDDGIYWIPKDKSKPWLGLDEWRPYAYVHGQGRMLRAMVAWYQYTGDPAWKKRIDKMVDGLDRVMVVHKDDYAYFPTSGWLHWEYFRSCYIKDRGWKDTSEPENEKGGEEGSVFNHQGHVAGGMATWYMLTGNKQALKLSGELVRFLTKPKFWADWKGGEYPGVYGPDHAHWQGHLHGHVNALRAILDYAVAANDSRLKEFVRDGYEWARQSEIARIGLVGDGQGCGCGRLIGLAVKLTYAGVGDYWEDIDLYIRNQGVEMQFTPEDIPYIKKLGEGKPPPREDPSGTTEGVIDATMGGYSNHSDPYKCSTSLCCSPHGNMGLFYAWDGIIRFSDGVAQVNLLLNRASPWMDIDSYLPYEGKVVLKNKTASEALVRIPLWVELNTVKCHIGKRTVKPAWFGLYLRIGNLKPGDTVAVEFPVAERVERWTGPPRQGNGYVMPFPADTVYTLRFRGNTLIEISPPISFAPWLYSQRAEKYRAAEAQMRKTTRYVTSQVLQW